MNQHPRAKPGNEPVEKSTLTAEDWELAALSLIAEKGIGALAVEPLARRLGITKGSFYWHFSNRDDLLVRSLERWEKQDTDHISIALSADLPPAQRLAEFVRRTSRQTLTHRVYAALCAAPNDGRVKQVLQRVTRRRIDNLTAAFSEHSLSPDEARHRARLTYTAYMGFLQLEAQSLAPAKDDPEFETYVEYVIRALILPDQP